MIRVIYRWRVEPENFQKFKEAWSVATNHIHETVPGALGSFMLRSRESDCEVLTVAKWDSVASWKNFWGNAKPVEMEEMRKLGERTSVEAFDEIEDYTR